MMIYSNPMLSDKISYHSGHCGQICKKLTETNENQPHLLKLTFIA